MNKIIALILVMFSPLSLAYQKGGIEISLANGGDTLVSATDIDGYESTFNLGGNVGFYVTNEVYQNRLITYKSRFGYIGNSMSTGNQRYTYKSLDFSTIVMMNLVPFIQFGVGPSIHFNPKAYYTFSDSDYEYPIADLSPNIGLDAEVRLYTPKYSSMTMPIWNISYRTSFRSFEVNGNKYSANKSGVAFGMTF